MRFLLNIGNTHTQIARDGAEGIELLAAVPTADLLKQGSITHLDQSAAPWSAKAACVVPAVQQALQKQYPGQILFISSTAYPELDFSRYDVRTLGADRIANAAAAYSLGIGAILVLDFGTCVTTEAIDTKGVFRGGAILPGRAMLRRSLAAFTAQLPEIPMYEECPPPLGLTTAGAIAAGVDLGIIGTVRQIIEKTRQEPGLEHCRTIAVGGDAAYFMQNIPGLEAGPEAFTLRGIRLAKGC
ncbi:MAG: type III pantothenate kinase [Lentisphaerae bacterium]|jgi:type III pantothenate kinase|nr:type III pantothenate kinase [Lentisphaerota bacterium]